MYGVAKREVFKVFNGLMDEQPSRAAVMTERTEVPAVGDHGTHLQFDRKKYIEVSRCTSYFMLTHEFTRNN